MTSNGQTPDRLPQGVVSVPIDIGEKPCHVILTVSWMALADGTLDLMPVGLSVTGPITPDVLPLIPTSQAAMQQILTETAQQVNQMLQDTMRENMARLTIAGPNALKDLPPIGKN
jgi:hypothetical protein